MRVLSLMSLASSLARSQAGAAAGAEGCCVDVGFFAGVVGALEGRGIDGSASRGRALPRATVAGRRCDCDCDCDCDGSTARGLVSSVVLLVAKIPLRASAANGVGEAAAPDGGGSVGNTRVRGDTAICSWWVGSGGSAAAGRDGGREATATRLSIRGVGRATCSIGRTIVAKSSSATGCAAGAPTVCGLAYGDW